MVYGGNGADAGELAETSGDTQTIPSRPVEEICSPHDLCHKRSKHLQGLLKVNHESRGVPWQSPQPASVGPQKCSYDDVRLSLVRFVRGILKPLFKAGVISKEIYKEVAKKTVDKVMGAHCKDENADFLIHEGDRIRKLIGQYVEYCRLKKRN